MYKPKKKLDCFCNDDRQCPPNQIHANGKRYCTTESVCFTKRHQTSKDSKPFFKYYCDDMFFESIRDNVIQYRDCLVNQSNKFDESKVIQESAEYCCDSESFCNELLKPIQYVKPWSSYEINEDSISEPDTLFKPINVIFLSILAMFVLTIFVILIIFLLKRNKVAKKLKPPKQASSIATSHSSGASTTSSNKSKSTNSTSVPITEKTDQTIPPYFPRVIESKNIVATNQNQLDHQISLKKRNEYLSNHVDKQITAVELFEPLLQPKQIRELNTEVKVDDIKPIYNSSDLAKNVVSFMPLTLGSDFCTSSECYTNTTSGGIDSTLSSSQAPSTQGSASAGFEWSGSGSGAGVPQLLPRTISRQIKLIYPCIGKGRFGEVYKGLWRDETIAVKTFNSADEKSWENECAIYNTSGFRHENILGFIASDNIDRGTYTELWIITEYHHNGSLYDYLNQPGLRHTAADTLRMALSIVNGLDHLHTPIESCRGKPALAHCDLKSKNILVKADLTCCISDLGLALCGDKNGNVTQNPATIRTGTKRYMAPEILAKTINYRSLLQFQNAEMYSLALIFWELLRRTSFELVDESTGEFKTYTYDYRLPYYEHLQSDPDEQQMFQVVCERKKRPEINPLWRQVPILNELTDLTEELWVENANGRLNALRLKKSLNQIKRKLISMA